MSKTIECLHCCQKRKPRFLKAIEVYSTPWDNCSDTRHLCIDSWGRTREFGPAWDRLSCWDVMVGSAAESDGLFKCDLCERLIYLTHPRQGLHVQYRHLHGEMICLACYQK